MGFYPRHKRTHVSIVCLIGGQVLVPAAAEIPTPRVYLNVAAVKKLVVELLASEGSYGRFASHPLGEAVFPSKVLL